MTNVQAISPRVLELLVELGRASVDEITSVSDKLLSELAPHDHINRLHWNSWDAVTEGLGSDDHEMLVRGLAVAEKGLRWCGGSVSAVIWTYRSFETKAPERANALADWMLKYSDNPYVPFGYSRGSACSLDEVRRQNEARRERSEAHKKREKQQQEQAAIRRCKRADHAAEHVRIQQARSVERENVLGELGDAPLVSRLKRIASDLQHPPSWYPDDWAELTDEEISNLPNALINHLKARLADRKRGPWRRLYRRLAAVPVCSSLQNALSGDA